MKKLPNGKSNYEDIVKGGFIYVDKTQYIEKLENLTNSCIMFLRPRKFGKTLFTSLLENYYDILKKDEFEELFSNTYIGKCPTENRNKYHILRFNFSGITTKTEETALKGFREKVDVGIKDFIEKYKIDFYLNPEQTTEGITINLFQAFKSQKSGEKIYVIIDEYDHFANELLGFNTELFKNLISKNGSVRKWYEVLKEGTETVVDRIFITGVAPITLDSMTSGFNISRDITKNIAFNDMLGFTEEEVKYIMEEIEIPKEKQEELLPIIKQNYDGYVFSNEIKENINNYRMYNSNMTLYFLNEYIEKGEIPEELVDVNIISDYSKIEALINLDKTEEKMDLLEKIVAGESIESELTQKFNSEMDFGEKELISLLYYLGYLTISGNEWGILTFKVPNDVMRKIYTEYYYQYIKKKAGIKEPMLKLEIVKEILLEGKIEKLVQEVGKYLANLSNRDYSRFDGATVEVEEFNRWKSCLEKLKSSYQ